MFTLQIVELYWLNLWCAIACLVTGTFCTLSSAHKEHTPFAAIQNMQGIREQRSCPTKSQKHKIRNMDSVLRLPLCNMSVSRYWLWYQIQLLNGKVINQICPDAICHNVKYVALRRSLMSRYHTLVALSATSNLVDCVYQALFAI
jgi:hypothetical protein